MELDFVETETCFRHIALFYEKLYNELEGT